MTGTMEFGYPGDDGLGDRLIAAVLSGAKTATSHLAVEHQTGDPLPRPGELLPLVDHVGGVHGTVEVTRVRILPLSEVGDDVALAEGEGFADAVAWRRSHIRFWEAIPHLVRQDAGDPDWRRSEHEPVVVTWFRLIDRR